MGEDKWGVGKKATEKAFGRAVVGNQEVELILGEHPHSRSDNNIYARYPDGRTEEFDGHRIQVKVEIETHNYLKQSNLSGNEIRKGGTGRIFFNDHQVFEFFFRDPRSALLRAHHLLDQLLDCPVDLWDAECEKKLIGRKVYYRDTPAVITAVVMSQGCVIVRAETPTGLFPKPVWSEIDEEPQDEYKVEVIDPHLWWWRREEGGGGKPGPTRESGTMKPAVESAPPSIPTKEKLARALEDANLHDLAQRARAGEFSDFESNHAAPKMELVHLLRPKAMALAQRIMAGEFDDTREESEAWFKRRTRGRGT